MGLQVQTDSTANIPPGLGHFFQEGWSPRATPAPPAAWVCSNAKHWSWGFPITELGQLEEAWFSINNLLSLGKEQL